MATIVLFLNCIINGCEHKGGSKHSFRVFLEYKTIGNVDLTNWHSDIHVKFIWNSVHTNYKDC